MHVYFNMRWPYIDMEIVNNKASALIVLLLKKSSRFSSVITDTWGG